MPLCSRCRQREVEPAYLGSGNTRCENCWVDTVAIHYPSQRSVSATVRDPGDSRRDHRKKEKKNRGFQFTLAYVLNH
jgi:hypothetical protein